MKRHNKLLVLRTRQNRVFREELELHLPCPSRPLLRQIRDVFGERTFHNVIAG